MNVFADEEVKEEFFDFMMELTDDVEASQFCVELLYVFHKWDDFVDGDPVNSEDANQAFFLVFSKFQGNTFFRTYEKDLQPLILSSILQWFDANAIEKKGEPDELRKAYMLRANIYQIWAYCVFLLKGYDFYIGMDGLMQTIYNEKYDDYIKEFTNA